MEAESTLSRSDMGTQEVVAERRDGTRIPIVAKVKYRLFRASSDSWIDGEAVNLSQGGLQLLTLSDPSDMEIGDPIELELPLEGMKKNLRPVGEVYWKKPFMNGNGAFRCGIRFVEMAHADHIGFLADELCWLAQRNWNLEAAHPATTLEELKDAYRLVYQEFLKRGYCAPNSSNMYYHYFCVLPESRTFLLHEDHRLLGTVTVVSDSACGLPMESLFPDEIGALRIPGRKLAEVGLLAVERSAFGKKRFPNLRNLPRAFSLFKIVFDYARFAGITDLVIAMHPKHRDLYRYLSFDTIGSVRPYAGACGSPALAMRLDVPSFAQNASRDHDPGAFFLKNSMPAKIFKRRYQWDLQALDYFLLEREPLWRAMSCATQDFVKACYPDFSG